MVQYTILLYIIYVICIYIFILLPKMISISDDIHVV